MSATPETGTVIVDEVNPLMSRFDGPSPVMQVGLDMVKRGAIAAPAIILISTLIWGVDGAASVLLAMGIVLVNVLLSAYIIAFCARISFAALAAGAMFGFLIRLGLITAVVLLVRNETWVDLVALSIALVVTHLGLLFWELRYISASLAYPGLKPAKGKSGSRHKETVSS